MRLRFISAALALATVTPVLAPVMAHATASQAIGFTWTGLFVGINGGYGHGSSDWDFKNGGGGSTSHTIGGGLLGLQAGYNAQLANNFVAGIEISTEATDINGNSSCSGSRCHSRVASLSDVSGRFGVNWGTSLLFAKGGVAYQNLRDSIRPAASEDDKGGSVGYVAGAGVEFYIDNNITSNLEYNYYRFGSDSARVGASRFDDSDSISVVKAGLNLKFN